MSSKMVDLSISNAPNYTIVVFREIAILGVCYRLGSIYLFIFR